MSMGTRKSFFVFVSLLVLGVAGGLARAQALEALHHSFKVGGWELNTARQDDGTLMGLWGIPTVPVEVGHIRRLWFEALPDGEWDVYAYEPKNADAKAAELFAAGMSEQSLLFFQSRERLAALIQADQDIDGGVEGPVEKGFIAGDPMTDTAGAMDDPDPMIDLLADVQYPVAPGMTELMVEGTAGASVNMNQATKELINCLRATMSNACAPCVCVEWEGMIQRDPWTVGQTTIPDSNQIQCDYSRVITHSYWQEGEYPGSCEDCTVGSPDEPATWTETEEHTDIWFDIDTCPDEPLPDPH